ncbi:hypothetical protein PCL1606_05250 [Pseudomonas chlororaphis]|uniref:Uncharacterized protein n=1 Tax=Pseudomonas chlororaphis TaxID=587753 RepID=A0A0D5XT05_9PSED|nr:hypothetical protein PCL1606_05250 [Pseudomonas chlororaphis]
MRATPFPGRTAARSRCRGTRLRSRTQSSQNLNTRYVWNNRSPGFTTASSECRPSRSQPRASAAATGRPVR